MYLECRGNVARGLTPKITGVISDYEPNHLPSPLLTLEKVGKILSFCGPSLWPWNMDGAKRYDQICKQGA